MTAFDHSTLLVGHDGKLGKRHITDRNCIPLVLCWSARMVKLRKGRVYSNEIPLPWIKSGLQGPLNSGSYVICHDSIPHSHKHVQRDGKLYDCDETNYSSILLVRGTSEMTKDYDSMDVATVKIHLSSLRPVC